MRTNEGGRLRGSGGVAVPLGATCLQLQRRDGQGVAGSVVCVEVHASRPAAKSSALSRKPQISPNSCAV